MKWSIIRTCQYYNSHSSFNVHILYQEGKLEAEEFTSRLYKELNSSPQPYLVPFLKVRRLIFYCYFHWYTFQQRSVECVVHFLGLQKIGSHLWLHFVMFVCREASQPWGNWLQTQQPSFSRVRSPNRPQVQSPPPHPPPLRWSWAAQLLASLLQSAGLSSSQASANQDRPPHW